MLQKHIDPMPSEERRLALAEIVSDSLAATTEGTDWAEAPVPSDEPGSPYVLRLTNELIARGAALPPDTREEMDEMESNFRAEALADTREEGLRVRQMREVAYGLVEHAEKLTATEVMAAGVLLVEQLDLLAASTPRPGLDEDSLTFYTRGVNDANRWWAERYLAAHKSDGSGRQASADMNELTNTVLAARQAKND